MIELTPETEAALNSGHFFYKQLVEMQLPSVTLYLTTAGHDINHDGITWLSNTLLTEIPDVNSDVELKLNETSITLAADQALLAEVLGRPIINRLINVYLAILDSNSVPLQAIRTHGLMITGSRIQTASDKATIQISVASEWADFEAVRGINTNLASHQRHYPGDMGFEFAYQVKEDLKWGAK